MYACQYVVNNSSSVCNGAVSYPGVAGHVEEPAFRNADALPSFNFFYTYRLIFVSKTIDLKMQPGAAGC